MKVDLSTAPAKGWSIFWLYYCLSFLRFCLYSLLYAFRMYVCVLSVLPLLLLCVFLPGIYSSSLVLSSSSESLYSSLSWYRRSASSRPVIMSISMSSTFLVGLLPSGPVSMISVYSCSSNWSKTVSQLADVGFKCLFMNAIMRGLLLITKDLLSPAASMLIDCDGSRLYWSNT